MPRKPIEDEGKSGHNGQKGATGVSYYIKVPLSLAERIEDEIHARTIENLRATGSRAEASASGFFREAAEEFLKACEKRRGNGHGEGGAAVARGAGRGGKKAGATSGGRG